MNRPGRFLLAALAASGLVAAAAAPAMASNDPDFAKQYGVSQVNAPSAWAKTRGAGVIIAVVDSGVDTEHPDLRAKLVKGHDFADDDDNPDDDSELKDSAGKAVKGHGTHVAGIASAITDNGVGIAGVAPDAKIMPLKVFSSGSGGTLGFAAVPQAIKYAVDNGARVINLSLGTFETGVSLVGFTQTACNDALTRGALCVVAAGNSGADNASGYPYNYPGLIVTAHDEKGAHASFGQKADTQWSLSAPGVQNWSTVPVEQGSYGYKSGTSMAAPHAAGVAALVFAALNPPATTAGVREVLDKLLSTAHPMGNPGSNGAGRIDAAAALGVPVQEAPPTTAEPSGSSQIPQTYNEKLRQQQGATTVKPAGGQPAGAPPSGGTPGAPAATAGDTPDPNAPNTKGIKLAGGSTASGASSKKKSADSGKVIAIVIAAAGLLGTGGWGGSIVAAQQKTKRLKTF